MNDLNLNPFLFPNNSPYVQNLGLTSAYDFDYQNEAGIITNGKIRTLTADKIVSGTIDASVITVANVDPANINAGTVNSNVNLNPASLLGGTLNTTMNVGSASGSAYVKLDGPNNRIIVNDGTVDRIIIGNI